MAWSRLSAEDREEIAIGVVVRESARSIARRLGRAPSTITREVARNRPAPPDRHRYRAGPAGRKAWRRARRPKAGKLTCPVLARAVSGLLELDWSPEQIAAKLRVMSPDDLSGRVSHETIYQALYVQGRGELRRELARHLGTGRTARKPQGRLEKRGRLVGMVNIRERPAEAADRAVPGHWEGDLVLGGAGKGAVITLVERTSRFVMLFPLGSRRTAEVARDALTAMVLTLPDHVKRTLTWDQGKEMADHATFTFDSGVQVYFCDPHSPWQRGTNENTNGLLRQYLPKGCDMRELTVDDCDRIALRLNTRPRETLGWKTPQEVLDAALSTPPAT